MFSHGQWVRHLVTNQVRRVCGDEISVGPGFVWCEWMCDGYHLAACPVGLLEVAPEAAMPDPSQRQLLNAVKAGLADN
jgi:hypothetical protein